MIHPLLRLLASQPHLLADHAHAYGSLLGDELSKTAASWKTRMVLFAAAAFMLVLALLFAGVAVMLWAAATPSGIQAPWALIAVPAVPAVLAIVCGLVARRPPEDPFKELKHQFAADMALFREASAS